MSLDTQIADLITATTALTAAAAIKTTALASAVAAATATANGAVVCVAHAYSNKQFDCGGRNLGDNVLLDTVVIPAGTMGPTSMIEVYAMYSFPVPVPNPLNKGMNGKDPLIRIGPTSGNFATALNILNNQGFSTTRTFTTKILGHNQNSLSANIWTPPQSSGTGNQGSNLTASYAVDWSQSVTLYFGGTCTNTYGDPTDIVRLETYSVMVMK